MVIFVLAVLGLVAGSFVNALVWRVFEQEKKGAKASKELSVLKGRSMCVHCKHQLAAKDLLPVISWVTLGGKCRYCKKPISVQYPLVELFTALLFMLSGLWWSHQLDMLGWAIFSLWLIILTGLVALMVYDFKWQLLPNKIMAPLGYITAVFALLNILTAFSPEKAFLNLAFGVAVGGGVFYLLYQVSGGRWIGGGDVKLGFLLGAIVASPAKAVMFIFLAALLGTIVSLPLLAMQKLKPKSTIPFGPFLIAGAFIAVLFGNEILHWYMRAFLV